MDIVSAKTDASSLNLALTMAQKFSSRTPQKCVDAAAYAVAARTYQLMPVVEVAEIDSDLGTMVTIKVGKRGKPLSSKLARNRILSGGKMGDIVKNVPLAVLIIQAQASYGSNLNERTGYRFARSGNPFSGVSREDGRAAMKAAENKMINARHSSGGFLRLPWAAIKKILRSKAYGPLIEDGTPENEAIGFGTAFSETKDHSALCTFEDRLGMVPGKKGYNAPNYNRAMLQKSLGPLQQAIDEVALEKMDYVFKKEKALLKVEFEAIPV